MQIELTQMAMINTTYLIPHLENEAKCIILGYYKKQ